MANALALQANPSLLSKRIRIENFHGVRSANFRCTSSRLFDNLKVKRFSILNPEFRKYCSRPCSISFSLSSSSSEDEIKATWTIPLYTIIFAGVWYLWRMTNTWRSPSMVVTSSSSFALDLCFSVIKFLLMASLENLILMAVQRIEISEEEGNGTINIRIIPPGRNKDDDETKKQINNGGFCSKDKDDEETKTIINISNCDGSIICFPGCTSNIYASNSFVFLGKECIPKRLRSRERGSRCRCLH